MAKTSLARTGRVVPVFGEGMHIVVGRLTRIDDDGVPHVDFPGNARGELPARVLGPAGMPPSTGAAPEVALAFEGGNPARPLILGFVSTRFEPPPARDLAASGPQRELFIDGQTVRIAADSELLLRCGHASILLRSDGKLIIKGIEVLSRASGTNKIKGGLVNIN
jgi:hypothetical protein